MLFLNKKNGLEKFFLLWSCDYHLYENVTIYMVMFIKNLYSICSNQLYLFNGF